MLEQTDGGLKMEKEKLNQILGNHKLWIETNEEKGVVYIPKFIIDTLVKEMTEEKNHE